MGKLSQRFPYAFHTSLYCLLLVKIIFSINIPVVCIIPSTGISALIGFLHAHGNPCDFRYTFRNRILSHPSRIKIIYTDISSL